MGGDFLRMGCVGIVLLTACESPQRPDLEHNEQLYRFTTYRTKVPPDRAVFVPPVADGRDAMPASAGAVPTVYMPENRWERPAAEMVDGVLREELRRAQLFTGLRDAASPADLVLQVTLVAFHAGASEHPHGRSTFAESGIRCVVLGPADAKGERATLLDRTFGEKADSEVGMRPTNAMVLQGMTMRSVVQKALLALDQSNVARSSAPAPAATRKQD